jgi:uncharacterized membrane protein
VRTTKNILISFGIALVGTTLEVLYQKIGGFASGGRYVDAHTVDELLKMYPFFLLTFLLIFFACFVYFQLGKKDK